MLNASAGRIGGSLGILPFVALVVVAGCADPASRDRQVGSLDDAPEFGLSQSYRLGGVEASEEEAYTREPRLAVRSDGRVFVLDQGAGRVSEYAANGAFVRAFGGRGEGPGEFTFPGDIGMVGDTVWVRNLSPPFVSLFDLQGTLLRRHTVTELAIGRTGVPDGPDAMLAGGHHLSIAQVPLGSEPGPQRVPLRLVSASGSVDTVGFVVDPPSAYVSGVGTLRAWYPGSVPPRWAATPDGRAVVLVDWDASGEISIRSVAPEGDETVDTLRLTAVPIAAASVDSIVSVAADSTRARIGRARERLPPEVAPTVPSDLEERIRSALDLGSALPPVRSVLIGTGGALWIERPIAPNRWEWAVFDRRLRPIGRIGLPDGHTLRAATPDGIWTTHTGDLDVPYVTKFELLRPGAPDGSR